MINAVDCSRVVPWMLDPSDRKDKKYQTINGAVGLNGENYPEILIQERLSRDGYTKKEEKKKQIQK